ncbi:hypothetical protein [Paraburkholderia sp. SOS3]|uniref:hypothetical protein n=1 Tax=Paraburkholderia sp. SOS3 TaxID=1926494 RepID=UPI0012EB6158|nr:hypothetical protein [Paraburkholderia sp. SOS3]
MSEQNSSLKFFIITGIYFSVALGVLSPVQADEYSPSLSFTNDLPSNFKTLLSRDGFVFPDSKGGVVWKIDGVRHFFLLLQAHDDGCGIVTMSEKDVTYKLVESYDRCHIIGVPQIVDLVGQGDKSIVVKMRLHSNGFEDGTVEHINAYLYAKERGEFCRNEDAGSFADGMRVPNAVIKFGPSDCR